MGMYTELVIGVELIEGVPNSVIEALEAMIDNHDLAFLPNHELFRHGRWKWMLMSSSYYFDGDTHSTVRRDDISRTWFLTVRCDLKNYESEIELFLDWIRPYTQTRGFVGYHRYEEDDDPTLIYFMDKVILKEVK